MSAERVSGGVAGAQLWGEIDGREVHLPVVVEEMSSATLTFNVPIEPARALVPGDAFEVTEVAPGQAMLVIALVDYIRNPWGDYAEVNLGLMAHPVGDPHRQGAFVWRMPVDQEFTCTAGNLVMGLPKTVEEISFAYSKDAVDVALVMGGEPALRVRVPRVRAASEPSSETMVTWSYLDGVPMAVPLTIDLPTGLIAGDEILVELGSGPVADELRSLGLPRAPDLALWGEGLGGTFLAPEPVGVEVESSEKT